MTIYCSLFHLLNTVFNLLNIYIYMVNILWKSHNIVDSIERVQRGLCKSAINCWIILRYSCMWLAAGAIMSIIKLNENMIPTTAVFGILYVGMNWTLQKILIISKNPPNESCAELNVLQKTQQENISIYTRSGARGLQRFFIFEKLYCTGMVE